MLHVLESHIGLMEDDLLQRRRRAELTHLHWIEVSLGKENCNFPTKQTPKVAKTPCVGKDSKKKKKIKTTPMPLAFERPVHFS